MKYGNKNTDSVTAELLSEMYRNVTTATDSLASVVPYIKDKFMLSNVTSQLEKYAEFATQTEALLQKHGAKAEKIPLAKRAVTRGSIAVGTLLDKSDSHIAQMIADGTESGMHRLEGRMDQLKNHGADAESVSLCHSIVDFEHTEADKIKDYT